GAEGRALIEAPRQITVEPIGGGSEDKDDGGSGIAPLRRCVKQQDKYRDQQDAQQRQLIGNIHTHRALTPIYWRLRCPRHDSIRFRSLKTDSYRAAREGAPS